MSPQGENMQATEPLAHEAMEQRLYEALIANTPDLIYAFDLQYRFTFANRALLEMWGKTLEESVGKSLLEIGYEPWHAEMHEREIDEVVSTKAAVRGEVGFPHATLGWRVYDYIFSPVFNRDGEVEWISGATRDITELKETQEHLQLVLKELNHRVKNTLATIQSIARQTFRTGKAQEEALEDFEGRLLGLSNAHNILTRTNWESADIRELASRALAPFRVDGAGSARITTTGGKVELPPHKALALAMALHELGSNAVKYGALSQGGGHVDLSWSDNPDSITIEWRELGGPPVTSPKKFGFGSRLIQQGLARELGGTVELDFRPTGLCCTIRFPLTTEHSGT